MTSFVRIRRAVRAAIGLTLDRLANNCRHAWHIHRLLLRTNSGYAATLAALAATMITRTELYDVLAALLAGALAVYRALTRNANELED